MPVHAATRWTALAALERVGCEQAISPRWMRPSELAPALDALIRHQLVLRHHHRQRIPEAARAHASVGGHLHAGARQIRV